VKLPALAAELIFLRDADLAMREKLAADGSLYFGYHPKMEEVHRRNASRLKEIIREHGWPGRTTVWEEASEAAWLILQHSIGDPEFQRTGLKLLIQAAMHKEIPAWQAAMLEDRIAMYEGRPQRYGTQFTFDENGKNVLHPLSEPERVHELRASVGLPPLDQVRKKWEVEPTVPNQDWKQLLRQSEEWARRVGWRK